MTKERCKGLKALENIVNHYRKLKSKLNIYISTKQTVNYQEFTKYNNHQLLKRLQIISLTLIIVYIYYFIADFILLKDIPDMSFRKNLMIIHFMSLFISLIYLFIYQNIRQNEHFVQSKKSTILINLYTLSYAFLGVASSINSQKLTGNIDAYITIIIGIAVLLHIRPLHLLYIFLLAHLCFSLSLSFTSSDGSIYITKQINSTTTVCVAYLISFAFYTYRKNAFYTRIQLKEQEENFKKLFEINPFPLLLTSIVDGRIVEVNARAVEFYGVPREDAPKYKAADFYKHPEERRPIIEELRRTSSKKNHIVQQRVASGEYVWVILNFELIDYGNEKCILTGVTDISDLKKIEAELIRHASIDILTGIHNRRSGLMQLGELYVKAKEYKFPFTLCFVDVNNLKVVNDKYGHAEGDQLIKWACQVIKEHIDKEDIFFRYGGDEFIIVFPNKHLKDVNKLWEEIVEQLSSEHVLDLKPYPISVSHGLYCYDPEQNISIEEMIHLADEEMYRNKLELKKIYS